MSGESRAPGVHLATGPQDAGLSEWIADELAALGWAPDGLYVATSNAGHAQSVEFWRTALSTGLPFANPRLFPWTLANSPTGAIARRLGVRGPTYTLVGRLDAVVGAVEHAEDDLGDGVVTEALVVAAAVDSGGFPAVAATLIDAPLTTGDRESLIGTFAMCLTSSGSRPVVASPSSR